MKKLTEADINPGRKEMLWNLYPTAHVALLNSLGAQINFEPDEEITQWNTVEEIAADRKHQEILQVMYQEVVLAYVGGMCDGLKDLKRQSDELMAIYEIITEED